MKHLEGKRIRLVEMGDDDPDPIPPGSTGTVRKVIHLQNKYQLDMTWDSHVRRSLNLVCPPDVVQIIE